MRESCVLGPCGLHGQRQAAPRLTHSGWRAGSDAASTRCSFSTKLWKKRFGHHPLQLDVAHVLNLRHCLGQRFSADGRTEDAAHERRTVDSGQTVELDRIDEADGGHHCAQEPP
eukprot:NODE_22958_length_687_cov_3.158929.p2 GENE.NODE_22958_length_687_cov_3.158929~~NODE_22958_length_687_cov_3.158929.p2  ORF type:complete len:114 (+),score=11.91 NODE_22958_length_687_cov_3.158929:258-599(+)